MVLRAACPLGISSLAACPSMVGDSCGKERGWGGLRRGGRHLCFWGERSGWCPSSFLLLVELVRRGGACATAWTPVLRGIDSAALSPPPVPAAAAGGRPQPAGDVGSHYSCADAGGEPGLLSRSYCSCSCRIWSVRWGRPSSSISSLLRCERSVKGGRRPPSADLSFLFISDGFTSISTGRINHSGVAA